VPSFNAEEIDCRVSVFREGLLTAVGHDIDLQVTDLTLEIGDDDSITGEFVVDSLTVCSHGPSESDRKDIQKNAAKTLEARKYPTIMFRSTSVARDGDQAKIEGDLTLHGVTNSISIEARSQGGHWNAEVSLDQRKFDIKPFSAMMGALKVKPEVKVRISIPDA
jgi:polyisoprenoid-binding protein YceI